MPTKLSSNWTFVGQESAGTPSEAISVQEFPCLVGRGNDVQVRLTHPSISQRHAELTIENDFLVIRDIGSRNGTFVNGTRVSNPRQVMPGDLVQFGDRLYRLELRSFTHSNNMTMAADTSSDRALVVAQVERMIATRNVSVFLQAIVSLKTGGLHACESLARGRAFGVESPNTMFKAATHLQKEVYLSEMMREMTLECVNPGLHLFLNTHPSEIANIRGLLGSLIKLRQKYPSQPITLEIHEAAAAEFQLLKALRLALDDLNIRLAFDDFGAGQARIMELIDVRPHYLKFDMRMIRGLDQATESKRKLVQSLVEITQELGVVTLAEGIETQEEADCCRELGMELAQGFLFNKPMKVSEFQALATSVWNGVFV